MLNANFSDQFKLKLEFILIFLILTFFSWFMFPYLSGPVSLDELSYMRESEELRGKLVFLNRYFHIYLQRIFILMAPDPVLGNKLLWSFSFVVTSFVVYFNARKFTKSNNFLVGVTALIFFISNPDLMRHPGVAGVDVTLMMMMTVSVTLYIVCMSSIKYRKFLLILFGLFIFLTFKTKETGVTLFFLLLGLGWDENNLFSVKRFVNENLMVVTGIFIGILSFVFINWLMLEDALFGLRVSDWLALKKYNLGSYVRRGESWYKYMVQTQFMIPFCLYLIGMLSLDKFNIRERVVWMMPIVILMFLTVSMIEGKWGIIARYILPIVPIVSFLSIQNIFIRRSLK